MRVVAERLRDRARPPGRLRGLIARGDGSVVVAGPDTGPQLSALQPLSPVVGVRLRPGAAAAVLGVPLHALRDQRAARVDLGATTPSATGRGP